MGDGQESLSSSMCLWKPVFGFKEPTFLVRSGGRGGHWFSDTRFFFTLSLSDAHCFTTWLQFILPDDFGPQGPHETVCSAINSEIHIFMYFQLLEGAEFVKHGIIEKQISEEGRPTAQWLVSSWNFNVILNPNTDTKSTSHKRIVNTKTQTHFYTFFLSAISILAEAWGGYLLNSEQAKLFVSLK